MKKRYTKKQIAEAIAYWERQLRENNCKKINEWDDTHLPKGRVDYHKTEKPKRYSAVCEAQEAAGKSVVVVDVDTVINQDMLLKYDINFPIQRSAKHQGGELFIEQIFVVSTQEAEQLAQLGLFYSNFSPEASVVDYVSQLDPCAGHSDGVVRTAQREVPEQLAQALREITSSQPVDKVLRFVSPQAYTKNKEVFVSTNDDTVIDASKYIRVLDHGKIAALRDDSTGETLETGSDFEHMILTQTTGYWQEIDVQTMKVTDMPSSDQLGTAPVAAPGDRVKTISAKIQAFIQFIENRKKFLKTSRRAQPRAYEETYALVNNLQSGYGKNVGEFKTREEALAAAREDFARWIENGWIARHPRADRAVSPEDLALSQNQTGVFAPAGRYFRYAPRPGYKSSKISASWPLNKPIYTLKPVQKRVSESVDRRYTKKQIQEAIAYWERQLRAGNYKKINESSSNSSPTTPAAVKAFAKHLLDKVASMHCSDDELIWFNPQKEYKEFCEKLDESCNN